MHGTTARAWTSSGLVALVVVGSLAAFPPPRAEAHPFGPPPTARVWAEDRTVTIDWGAAPDDLAAIGVELDLLPEETPEEYLEAPTQVAPERDHEDRLSASPELRDYLLERVGVWQDGRPCDGEVRPIERFLTRGATIVHRCPTEVTEVEIEIGLLHDLHSAFRTFAFSASDEAEPSQAVFTAASPRHTWRFAAPAEDEGVGERARSAGVTGLVVLGVLAIAGVAGVELMSRRRDGSDEATPEAAT